MEITATQKYANKYSMHTAIALALVTWLKESRTDPDLCNESKQQRYSLAYDFADLHIDYAELMDLICNEDPRCA